MNASKGPYAPATKDEIRRKELGFVSHFLDGVYDNLGKNAVIAVGVAAAAGYLNDGFSPWMVPTAILAGLVPAAVQGLSRLLDAGDSATMHDNPAVQRFIRKVEETARGPVAAQRGSVWIVSEPGVQGVKVMSEREYARFKKDIQVRGGPLDEVLVRAGSVSVNRTVAGRLDPGGRNLPAVEGFDTRTGVPSKAGWYLLGGRAEPAAVAAASALGGPRAEYAASRFLAGGTGYQDDVPAVSSVAPPPQPRYSAMRFLSTGESGHNEPEEPVAAFSR